MRNHFLQSWPSVHQDSVLFSTLLAPAIPSQFRSAFIGPTSTLIGLELQQLGTESEELGDPPNSLQREVIPCLFVAGSHEPIPFPGPNRTYLLTTASAFRPLCSALNVLEF